MSKQIFNSDGTISYRTKPMPLHKARAFARCVDSNPRFVDVTIREARTRELCYFVAFRPASVDRCADMWQGQYDTRAGRAEEEGAAYVWLSDESGRFDWCFNPKSGETYEVSLFDCTCPDYFFRCRKAGLSCKHMQARGKRRATQEQTQHAPMTPERRARFMANVAKDFA
jgi:hypothetical protein